MREILFRGKRTDNGEWVYGTPILYPDGNVVMCRAFKINHNVSSKTVCQFTGLYDKNGRKIFEGDIVKHYIKNSEIVKIYIVEWENRLSKFVGRYKGDEYYGKKYAYAELHEQLIYEVIGNIYDNPELLEVK